MPNGTRWSQYYLCAEGITSFPPRFLLRYPPSSSSCRKIRPNVQNITVRGRFGGARCRLCFGLKSATWGFAGFMRIKSGGAAGAARRLRPRPTPNRNILRICVRFPTTRPATRCSSGEEGVAKVAAGGIAPLSADVFRRVVLIKQGKQGTEVCSISLGQRFLLFQGDSGLTCSRGRLRFCCCQITPPFVNKKIRGAVCPRIFFVGSVVANC